MRLKEEATVTGDRVGRGTAGPVRSAMGTSGDFHAAGVKRGCRDGEKREGDTL